LAARRVFIPKPGLGRTPQQWFDEAVLVDPSVRLELAAVHAAVAALPDLPAGVDLHVNLSPTVMVQAPDLLLQDVPMDRLVIELTEHEAVADYAGLTDALAPRRRSQRRPPASHQRRENARSPKLDCILRRAYRRRRVRAGTPQSPDETAARGQQMRHRAAWSRDRRVQPRAATRRHGHPLCR